MLTKQYPQFKGPIENIWGSEAAGFGLFDDIRKLLSPPDGGAEVLFSLRPIRPARGGDPGECEVEHPLATARRVGNRQVFLAGWPPAR